MTKYMGEDGMKNVCHGYISISIFYNKKMVINQIKVKVNHLNGNKYGRVLDSSSLMKIKINY